MATNNSMSPLFKWGDAVQIKENAPSKFMPSDIGSVCGIRRFEMDDALENSGHPLESYLYLVEFSNGEAIEVPELYLDIWKKS